MNFGLSFKVFRLFGVDVKVHWTLPVFWLGMAAYWADKNDLAWTVAFAFALLFVLWLTILAHEFGHVFEARRRGIECDEILLWPLGGLALIGSDVHDPWHEVTIAAAGPLVSVGCAVLLTGATLALFGPSWQAANPLSNLPRSGWGDLPGEVFHAAAFLNLCMAAFNVFVPAFPLDGGRILRGLLQPRIGFARATAICTGIAFGAAAVLVVVAIALRDLTLGGIALFVFLSARQERMLLREGATGGGGQTFMGHDFSMGYTSLGTGPEEDAAAARRTRRRGPGLTARLGRLIHRASPPEPEPPPPPEKPPVEAPVETLRQKVDRLLEKVSSGGMASLTEEEKKFLQDASERFKRDR
ncbi:MAG TPA: site-2 protease family protein [Planctomycetota bacterium]|nr:site-2 protease family protein [Planctomycetota bacterium]